MEMEEVVDLSVKLHFFTQANDSEDCLLLSWQNRPGGNHALCS